jgi:hypothetical protein
MDISMTGVTETSSHEKRALPANPIINPHWGCNIYIWVYLIGKAYQEKLRKESMNRNRRTKLKPSPFREK